MHRLLLALCALLLSASSALANTYVIYVAPRDTPAYTAAEAKQDEKLVFAERRLHSALTQAAELLQAGPHTVNILVAAGEYPGKVRMGVWVLPVINNPAASLRIIGGFNDDWTGRQPFRNFVKLKTIEGRDGALLQISRRSALKQLVVSGLIFDAAPSNNYDSKTNSILKGTSRTYPLISFSQLKIEHLVVDSNIFLNGAHGSFDPYVSPATANTVIDITNNFFLNNIKNMKAAATSSRVGPVKQINIRHNSILLNWPFNPDPTSSNVSAIELYHKDGCAELNIERNIFAFNPGGALQHDWPDDRMPEIAIQDNLFFMNSALFQDGDSEGGAIVGKFGTNPKHLVLDMITIEDDLDYDVGGNESFDPQIPIAMAPLQSTDGSTVQRQNTVINDVRRLFGLNQDGGTVAIKNYAPKLVFEGAIPLPQNEKAKPYGVQPTRLWKP